MPARENQLVCGPTEGVPGTAATGQNKLALDIPSPLNCNPQPAHLVPHRLLVQAAAGRRTAALALGRRAGAAPLLARRLLAAARWRRRRALRPPAARALGRAGPGWDHTGRGSADVSADANGRRAAERGACVVQSRCGGWGGDVPARTSHRSAYEAGRQRAMCLGICSRKTTQKRGATGPEGQHPALTWFAVVHCNAPRSLCSSASQAAL